MPEKTRQIQSLYFPEMAIFEEATVTINDDDEMSCRICLETATREHVISPCACSGSSKWVHRLVLIDISFTHFINHKCTTISGLV